MIFCFLCKKDLASKGLCPACWVGLTWKGKVNSWVSSLFIYEKSAIELIHFFKYKSPWLWIKLLVNWFKLFFSDLINSCDLLIPIALHRRKLAKRGYNQMVILTRAIAKTFSKDYLISNLVKKINNKSQTLLTKEERLDNAKDSFTLIKPEKILTNQKIILLDDVVTTGSTLAEARKALLPRTDQIFALTIAASKYDLAS
jgi:ComF family protein